RAALPNESIVYFGDTARLPYGNKTGQTVSRFVSQIIAYLERFEPKHVVIACNTATALALPLIREQFLGLTISGVIDPGAKAAVVAAGKKATPVIGVIATEATVKSRAYERAIVSRRRHARLTVKPTPLLVPIIEEGRREEDALVKLALRQYIEPMMKKGLDVLVLGCTHYPILKKAIVELVGPDVAVIDSAQQCADDVARRLADASLLRDGTDGPGDLRCFVTDDPDRFARLGSRFLGVPIEPPTWVCADELYELIETEDD
ncbi:MAG TPA: glutamate racemase, partial [Pirellulales bacterium]|nr:glutamate racemase [Pirellulales bacterium]